MLLKTLLLLSLALLLSADILQLNSRTTPITLKSQHNQKQELLHNGIWIISSDKKRTKMVNEFFDNFEKPNSVNLIMDTTRIPSFLFNLFVLPRIKKHKHQILLSHDKAYNSTLPYKKGYLTILHVKSKIVTKIQFLKNREDLEKFFQKP